MGRWILLHAGVDPTSATGIGPASHKFCSLVFSASASSFQTATNLSVIVGVRSQDWILGHGYIYVRLHKFLSSLDHHDDETRATCVKQTEKSRSRERRERPRAKREKEGEGDATALVFNAATALDVGWGRSPPSCRIHGRVGVFVAESAHLSSLPMRANNSSAGLLP